MDDQLSNLAVGRQRGLSHELSSIANNIANAATTGFQREGVVFSEFIVAPAAGASFSFADLNGRFISKRSGEISVTGGALDLAIDGPGYFMLDRGGTQVLTRAGAFERSPEGLLVTPLGEPVLDEASAPIFIPPEGAPLTIAADGTISGEDGPIARLGIVIPVEGSTIRADGAALLTDAAIEPVEVTRLRQGALEGSNVQPVVELARMIEVTRAYERVQSLVEEEDGRIRNALETLGRAV